MKILHSVFLSILLWTCVDASALRMRSLGNFFVDPSFVSVSGISSGGYMAVQMHVAYSASIMGAGIIAGGPFWCANDDEAIALTSCMSEPDLINVDELISITYTTAAALDIDTPSHLSHSRVYLFSGQADTVVKQGVMKKLEKYYNAFIPAENIITFYNFSAEHSFVTNKYGSPCNYLGSPYINDCNHDAAYEILQQIYGNITPSNKDPAGEPTSLFHFSQEEYFDDFSVDLGMDRIGYVYIPSNCLNNTKECTRLHVAFHGCEQSTELLNSTFVQNTGYNRHAELNNIIILYPQAHSNVLNPKGCFDWWGFTSPAYASKFGFQPAGVKKMIDSLLSP